MTKHNINALMYLIFFSRTFGSILEKIATEQCIQYAWGLTGGAWQKISRLVTTREFTLSLKPITNFQSIKLFT